MLRQIQTVGVGPADKLSLELGPRLNLLTGDNGLGKTFLLDVAWWALTATWAGEPAWPSPWVKRAEIRCEVVGRSDGTEAIRSRYEFERQAWSPQKGRQVAPSIVLYARVDGSFSAWDPARNDARGNALVNGVSSSDRPSAYHFSPATLWNGLTIDGKVLCNGLIRDWVAWQLQSDDAFLQLKRVLQILSPGDAEELRPGKPLRVSLEDVREIPTLAMPYGTVPLIYASAGMRRIVSLAYLLVWTWREHQQAADLLRRSPARQVVFLIDEVEAHLHPRWERLLLPSLLSVMEALGGSTKVQIVATTHEPLVLASVEPQFDQERDRLIHLCLDGKEVRVEEVPWAK